MDPINSWVDAVAVRKLAESLVAPSLQAEETPAETYGPAFVGYERPPAPVIAPTPTPTATTVTAPKQEAPRPAPQIPPAAHVENQARAALAGARQMAERGGILTSKQAPSVQTRPLSSPGGLFMERLHSYGVWLHKSVGAKAFFVADREGKLLIDEVNSLKLLQVARTLAQASWAASRQAGGEPAVGSLHVKLGAESILEVLPVPTKYGPLILGVVVPGPLPTATVQVVASSLQKVVNTSIQGA